MDENENRSEERREMIQRWMKMRKHEEEEKQDKRAMWIKSKRMIDSYRIWISKEKRNGGLSK